MGMLPGANGANQKPVRLLLFTQGAPQPFAPQAYAFASFDGSCRNWAEEYFSRLRRVEAGHFFTNASVRSKRRLRI